MEKPVQLNIKVLLLRLLMHKIEVDQLHYQIKKYQMAAPQPSNMLHMISL